LAKGKTPLRKCIGCNELFDKRSLIRIVKDSDGEFSIDSTGRKNGRGAYICKSKECLEKAIKNHGLERSFKVKIDKEIYDELQVELDALE
jgi:predicted RNA-binding protein YlxR (DUF448 family)